MSIAVSGSRSAVAAVVIVFVAVVLICLFRGKAGAAGLKYGLILCAICAGLNLLPVFREGIEVQQGRFEAGGGVHEGIVDRFFNELIDALVATPDAPLFGLGLGLGTNAGAGLVTGERGFLMAEGEWGRVIMESGPVLGIGYILLRFAILWRIWVMARKSFSKGNSLPLLLLSAMGLDLVTGQFGQPTELGFVVFTCGLCLVPVDGHHSSPDEARASFTTGAGNRKKNPRQITLCRNPPQRQPRSITAYFIQASGGIAVGGQHCETEGGGVKFLRQYVNAPPVVISR